MFAFSSTFVILPQNESFICGNCLKTNDYEEKGQKETIA